MTDEALDTLEDIRRNNGRFFTGQFPNDVIRELENAGLVERYYDSTASMMLGLSKIRIRRT